MHVGLLRKGLGGAVIYEDGEFLAAQAVFVASDGRNFLACEGEDCLSGDHGLEEPVGLVLHLSHARRDEAQLVLDDVLV